MFAVLSDSASSKCVKYAFQHDFDMAPVVLIG